MRVVFEKTKKKTCVCVCRSAVARILSPPVEENTHTHHMTDTDDVPLWQTQGVRVCVRSSYRSSSSPSDVQTLWIGVSETPSTEDVERLMAVLFPWFDVVEGGVCLHIEHCETEHIQPPEVGTLLLIAAKLLEAKDRIDRSLVGTVVQARHLDGPALMARDLFLGMYQPRKPLHIVQGRREARRCLEEVVMGK